MNKTALIAAAFALALAFALTLAFGGSTSAMAPSATPTPSATPALIDYDSDDDGLIEISAPAQLNAMRHDPDGDGNSSHSDYAAAFPNPAAGMGCKLAPSVPPDPSAPDTPQCVGYELTRNIDLSGFTNWTPIPAWETKFDGNHLPISNMTITRDGTTRQETIAGLFGSIGEGGTLLDVELKDADVSFAAPAGESRLPFKHVGVLAGRNDGYIGYSRAKGVLSYTSGQDINKPGAHVGGLVGKNHKTGTINASWAGVDVTITGNGARTGGFVGDNRGTISASFAYGNVAVNIPATSVNKYSRAGGFVGVNSGNRTPGKGIIRDSVAAGERSAGVSTFGPVCAGGGQFINVAPDPSGCNPN